MTIKLKEPDGENRPPKRRIANAMLCPVCEVPLTMSDRQNVEIDYCPQCRGVWLDRGELDKIIERSTREATQKKVNPQSERSRDKYDRDYECRGHRHGSNKHGHRRKSWLHELFD